MTSNDTSRRSMLKLAAAGLAGAGLAAGGAANEAEAANGDPLKLGVDVGQVANHGTGFAVQGITTSANAYGMAVTDEGFSNIAFNTYGACLVGHAQNINFNTGVTGIGFNGAYGVRGIADNGGAGLYGEGHDLAPGVQAYGESTGGYFNGGDRALLADCYTETGPCIEVRGTGLIRRDDSMVALPPVDGAYKRGDLACDASGSWVCVVSGTPGTWRKLAGSTTAGALHHLAPTRVYDTTVSGGALATGTSRTVSVAKELVGGALVVPAKATAVVVNISLSATTGTGNLLAYKAGITAPTANTLSWWGAGQAPCNQVLVAVSSLRQITLQATGSGSTHVALDVSGYYR